MGKHIGKDFPSKHGVELQDFLYNALMNGYGCTDQPDETDEVDGIFIKVFNHDDGSTTKISEYPSGKTEILHNHEDWQYCDTYYGGEPYSGISVISFEKIDCWSMTYWGRVVEGFNKEVVYDCLWPALMKVEKDHPFRGPKLFVAENGLRYENICNGDMFRFHGQESIKDSNDNWMFTTCYHGGFINLE